MRQVAVGVDMMLRRHFLHSLAVASATPLVSRAASADRFQLRYILASALYGEMALDVVLPEVAKTGCAALDLWCRPHGNQREQVDAMGDEAFAAVLKKHRVQLGATTRYPLGPFGLGDEITWLAKFGGGVIVTASRGPKEPQGEAAKAGVRAFLEQMKPHVARAEEAGVTLAIENHDNQLLCQPDSLRYFAEFNHSRRLAIAFAPHHLHRWPEEIPALIRDLGAHLAFVYLQEHSEGIRQKAPKEIEMRQLPGFGGALDYRPIVKALSDIRYSGFVEIFMHPTPRGIPILPTASEVTGAINRSRDYMERCRREVLG